jgi:hypothetical protein
LPRGLSVWDLTFAPDHRGLLLATHGRGIWVLDNLRPIEQYSAVVARAPFHAFTASPGVLLYRVHTNGVGPSAYRAPNAPTGAVISYHLAKTIKPTAAEKAAHHGPVRITIRDSAGTRIKTLYGPGKAGINALVWNLDYRNPTRLKSPLGKPKHAQGSGGGSGPPVLPGHYTATLRVAAYSQKVTLTVQSDPRYSVSLATERADTRAALTMRGELSAVNSLLNHVAAMRARLTVVLARARSDARWGRRHAALIAQGRKLQKTLSAYQNLLWNPHTQHDASEDFLRHFSHLHRRVETLYEMCAGLWAEKPRAQWVALIRADRRQIEGLLTRYDGTVLTDVKAWNRAAYAAGVATLPTGSPVTLHSEPALPPAGS